jgi:hypothetical protein
MISYPPAGAGVHARRQSVGKPRGKEVNARMKAGPAEAGLRINGGPSPIPARMGAAERRGSRQSRSGHPGRGNGAAPGMTARVYAGTPGSGSSEGERGTAKTRARGTLSSRR